MKEGSKKIFEELFERYPRLEVCRAAVAGAFEAMLAVYRCGGKILVCGNGGSAADAEHIVGELMKSFKKRRPIPAEVAAAVPKEVADRLEGALPACSLVSHSALVTAFANDVAWDTVFAQQVLGLGAAGDVLVALSTSGNSVNCVLAARVAKAKGMKVVALTGAGESALSAVADAAIRVPEKETYRVQELHLPVYHCLCAMLEEELF